MRAYRLLGLIGLLATTAAASTITFTINLPTVGGFPTLTANGAGQVVDVFATITTDTPLVLDDLSISESSVQGVEVGVSRDVYFDSGNNFYSAENPGGIPFTGPLTGQLIAVTLPTVSAESITNIAFSLAYEANSTPLTFTGNIFVVDEPPGVPEPATFAMMGLALSLTALYQRRRASRGR